MTQNSWHYNYYSDKSIIEEFLSLVNEERHLEVHMIDGRVFVITENSDVNLGLGAMLIAKENNVLFVNTDFITYVHLTEAEDLDVTE